MNDTPIRIYVAHGHDGSRKVLEANLELLKYVVEFSTGSSTDLIRRCEANPPDVAIVGTDFENDDIFSVANRLGDLNCCPVIALMRREDVDRSQRLMDDNTMGVLIQPASDRDLRPAIYLARQRFIQSRRMERRVDELRARIDDLEI